MRATYSLYKIDNTGAFGFDPAEYSKFKFGDDIIAEQYGKALARGFIDTYLSKLNMVNQLVVIPSPYAFIPTATFAMKNYFVYTLNQWLAKNELPVVQETKIHRTITYKEDYGALDAKQRMQLIGNDGFHIDKSFLNNKTLIFLDDIKITGSHERMITKMIDEFELTNDTYLLYFAELVNTAIHPNIENTLNYFHVKNIFDLHEIMNAKRFAINTRIVKYLLNYSSSEFIQFIQVQTPDTIALVYHMAIGNGYHSIPEYQTNLTYIATIINQSSKIEIEAN